MSRKHSSPKGSERTKHSSPRGSTPPSQQHLKGASRLVNPRSSDPEIVAPEEEDPGERDYLGRLLHVADEALHPVNRDGRPRKRRRVR